MIELLAHGTVVLDGGMSNALEDRGHDLSSDLWTARLLLDDPGEIVAVHRAYFAAGARVATTASYQASVPGLVAAGLSRTEAERLIASSVLLAREARDEAAAHTWAGAGTFDPTEVRSWINAGAQLVGGCCRVGPGTIAELARAVGRGSPGKRSADVLVDGH